MRRLNVLCLTDHSVHSSQNSVYGILNEMYASDLFDVVDVVSRGNDENEAFFHSKDYTILNGIAVSKDFKWTETGRFFKQPLKAIDFSIYDVILLRLPRPISDQFLIDIENVFFGKVIVNKPSGIIKTSNKSFLTTLGPLCPVVKLCHTREDIEDMLSHYSIVLKPLREYGGKGIVKITKDGVDTGNESIDIEQYLDSIENSLKEEPVLGMKYLKNVSNGDKRILVVNGKILGASLRLPKKGHWLCNVAQGGRSVKASPEPEEELIVKQLSPILLEKGILIYGMDTLEDDNGKRVLSEVNTLSIGGFIQIAEQDDSLILEKLIKEIYNYVIEHQ